MAKFKYRMAPLLRVRENEQKERQSELAKAFQAERILEGHMKENKQKQEYLLSQGRSAADVGEIDVDALLEMRRYQALLMAEHRDMEEKMRLVNEEIERRREALVKANQEVQVLEKLRDRQYERFLEDDRKRENKEMDEIAGRGIYKRTS